MLVGRDAVIIKFGMGITAYVNKDTPITVRECVLRYVSILRFTEMDDVSVFANKIKSGMVQTVFAILGLSGVHCQPDRQSVRLHAQLINSG